MQAAPAAQEIHATQRHTLRLRRLGIDTQQDHIVYMRPDCHVCRAEGFSSQARIRVELNGNAIVATLGRFRAIRFILREFFTERLPRRSR